ncbi:cystatin-like [Mustelus asterias]
MAMLMAVRGAVLVVLLASLAACSSLLGAPQPVSPDSPEVQKVAHFAISEYNKLSNDMYTNKVLRIVSAQQQLVAGINYILQVEVGRTRCRKESVDNLESCELHETPQKKLCHFVVHSIPWEEEISMTRMTCNQSSN